MTMMMFVDDGISDGDDDGISDGGDDVLFT